jgi:hypothetical protein
MTESAKKLDAEWNELVNGFIMLIEKQEVMDAKWTISQGIELSLDLTNYALHGMCARSYFSKPSTLSSEDIKLYNSLSARLGEYMVAIKDRRARKSIAREFEWAIKDATKLPSMPDDDEHRTRIYPRPALGLISL